jgi:hypothetical protein
MEDTGGRRRCMCYSHGHEDVYISMKAVLLVVVTCGLVEVFQRFRSICCLYYQGAHSFIALMMEAANTSEMLVNVYQTTLSDNPEDSHLRTRRRANLKSYV